MAITATHARLFRSLPLPRGGSLLEIGEANWYGDIEPEEAGDISGLDRKADSFWFDVCKVFYRTLFEPELVVSVDFNGTATAIRRDLNQPLPKMLPTDRTGGWATVGDTIETIQQFDVLINHGTAEHIFNIAQVFRTMHEYCEVGGLMIHDAPFTGWIDHGFYCLQPTLFYDLAAANNYEVTRVAVHEWRSQQIIPLESRDHVAKLAEAGKLPNNSMLFVCLRKLFDKPFRVPMQGVYSGALSEAGNRAWSEMR